MSRAPWDRQATMALICERMTYGESLSQICRDPDMPSKSNVMIWVNDDMELAKQYSRAREALGDHAADRIYEIADSDITDAAADRIKLDALKWAASKLNAQRYGDKITQAHTGPEGFGPVQQVTEVRMTIVDPVPRPLRLPAPKDP